MLLKQQNKYFKSFENCLLKEYDDNDLVINDETVNTLHAVTILKFFSLFAEFIMLL